MCIMRTRFEKIFLICAMSGCGSDPLSQQPLPEKEAAPSVLLHGSSSAIVTVPANAGVGERIPVTIRTLGVNGPNPQRVIECVGPGDTKIIVTNMRIDIIPFDTIRRVPPERACPAAVPYLRHDTSFTAPSAGAYTVNVVGRRINPDGE